MVSLQYNMYVTMRYDVSPFLVIFKYAEITVSYVFGSRK